MEDILRDAERLKSTGLYGDLEKAGSYMEHYRRGMLTVNELDAMKLLRPCAELLRVEEKELARRMAEVLRDFCLEVDRQYPVDRRMWILLGQLLDGDPFSVIDRYPVAVLREEDRVREGVLQPWDYPFLSIRGLFPRMTDVPVYAAAHTYIRIRGRARFAVRRWLMEDMERFYGERPEPTFPMGKALSFQRWPDVAFRPGEEIVKPWRRGQRVKLRLTDEKGMDFLPEVRILSDRRQGGGREARALAWYHNDMWLFRIRYDPERPEEARVSRYALYPLEFMGFHVLAFAVLAGDYRRREPPKTGDRIRVRLMDLWGRDVPLTGAVTQVHERALDFRAVFPDGKERGVTVYLTKREEDYGWDVAVVERWEQYPLPAWAAEKDGKD
jgi:hypothetical protein